MKIQYLTTEFMGKTLENIDIEESELQEHLQQYFNHDLVLMPFIQERKDHQHQTTINRETGEQEYMCGCADKKRAVLVSVKILDNQVFLFDKETREEDSKYFTINILK